MRTHANSALLTLALAGLASVVAALVIGSVHVPPREFLAVLAGGGDASLDAIVLDLRLPRALSAFATGALLALSGAILQALLRNPLADPYVLGVSGGAAVAALVALAFGAGALGMQVASIGGAIATMTALFVFARRALFARSTSAVALSDDGTTHVLLTGVMIASFCAAALSLLLSLAPDGRLRTMVFWLLGDLGGATSLRAACAALVVLVVGVAVAVRLAPPLNLLLRGDVQAFTQGVDVERTRRALVAVAAVATGAAVTLAGAIGFVGFIAPHLVRRVIGNDQRVLLPAAALAGGVLVVLADTVARSIVAPLQIPVGVLTAMIGVPLFLWLLRSR
ncbi:MAG: FecCD family ABC transporter permease [Gemmatimonadota bacterium]